MSHFNLLRLEELILNILIDKNTAVISIFSFFRVLNTKARKKIFDRVLSFFLFDIIELKS